MKKTNRYVRFFAAALLLCISLAMSLPVFAYPAHTDYISDSATVIDETTENKIKELSASLMKKKNVRVALCTVLDTGSESPAEYAANLYETWGVGHGVLLLIVTEADTFYAVQSNSISDVLTSAKLSDIINTTMEPRFAEKDYSGGAAAAAEALSTFMKENLPDGIGEKKGGMPAWLSVILKIILVLAILVIGGYALLVYFEKKRAREYRLAMEMRRRRLAEEGRQYRNGANPYQRPANPRPSQGSRPAYPPVNQRPVPRPQVRRNGQNTENAMERTGNYVPQRPRPSAQRYDDNAATVQISTADIRAARGGRDKYGRG